MAGELVAGRQHLGTGALGQRGGGGPHASHPPVMPCATLLPASLRAPPCRRAPPTTGHHWSGNTTGLSSCLGRVASVAGAGAAGHLRSRHHPPNPCAPTSAPLCRAAGEPQDQPRHRRRAVPEQPGVSGLSGGSPSPRAPEMPALRDLSSQLQMGNKSLPWLGKRQVISEGTASPAKKRPACCKSL